MTLDDKELKAIKRYLETILNSENIIKKYDGVNYIECAILRDDLEYIRETLRLRKEANDK